MVAHWLTPSAIACVLAASDKPIWAIAHGGDVHLLAKLGLTGAVARLLDRPNLHLNFVSQSVRDVFSKHAGNAASSLLSRAGVCSMGIDLPHFQALARARNDKRATQPLVLFLGRLVRLKGVDLLLEALRDLNRDCRVVIAGAGPERAALQQQARQSGLEIEWPGEVRGAARDQLLAAADIVVMPSREESGRQEGMPLVALEALASGAQLLVSRSGGLAEIPESICHAVPAEDVRALRNQLARLLDGAAADYAPGHWLDSHDWRVLGPRLLPGLSPVHSPCRSAQ
jgi:glycosyltransferase involved in cell wall biosynthesis